MTKIVLGALCAGILCTPAHAAVDLGGYPEYAEIAISGSIVGQEITTSCMTGPECVSSNSFSRYIKNTVFVRSTDFAKGYADFVYGHYKDGGTVSGRIFHLGEFNFAGGQLSFYSCIGCPDPENTLAFGGTSSFSAIMLNAPVPEPSTWAMLTLGFGLIGAASRKTKVLVRYG